MQYKKILLSILTAFFLASTTFAQRIEVGMVAGGASYIGDLNQNDMFKVSGITGGAFANYNFTPHVGVGLHYNYGNITANDNNSKNIDYRNRGINFDTDLHEISIIGEFNFLDAFSPISKRRFTPYIFAGVGRVYFKSSASYHNFSSSNLRKERTEGQLQEYKPYAATIPYGAGLKYKLTNYFTLSSQIGYRTAFTDYLDDVSGYYTGYTAPSNPNGYGEIGGQRGDLRKRDNYMFVSIGISYNFVSQKCFTF